MSMTTRLLALVWVWTGGAILGLCVLMVGTVYSLIDILTRLSIGDTAGNYRIRGGLNDMRKWWTEQHRYAFTGSSSSDFEPIPPWNFDPI